MYRPFVDDETKGPAKMRRPRQLAAIERNMVGACATVASGIRPCGLERQTLVGKRPSPACRALGEYGCR
jgi:hypothetical protein